MNVETKETPRPEPDAPAGPSAGARLLIDLGPLLAFFLTNFFAPVPDSLKVFVATGVFMVAMILAMLISQIRYRHISPLLWFSGIMVVIFGGLTIWLHNETFIKIKPTIYYLFVAGILLFGLVTGRNLLKLVLGTVYPGLSERGWYLLTRNWVGFFVTMAVANEAIWRMTSTDTWIALKLWLFLPVTFLFMIANVPMLMRHGFALEESPEEPPVPPTQ
ncbi:inner membrane-spanning protein YciB [Sphingosinicella terrae]|uniref:inner membrane-spanning protein YciB n=1 Tax=Sphingosinicella terrae TaxID=2172047 RepID=UPI000E0CC0B7|nr:inner membrane-spanning protein YciB [Sphingosinicella terrae]